MKFCLSLIGFFLISIALISPTQAVFINSKLDSSLIQETGIAKLVEKVIFSPTKIQNILNKSNEKYAQEIAYYFSKQGFKRSPASYILFENGDVVSLNNEWQVNQFDNNLDQGVLFVILAYKDSFNLTQFNNSINEFKNSTLNTLKATNLNSSENFEIRNFTLQNIDSGNIIEFKQEFTNSDLQNYFANIDFGSTALPDLKIENIEIPNSIDPQTTSKAVITIKNNSNFDYIFGENNFLEIGFEKDSSFFVNNKWLNKKTALVARSGFIKAGLTKPYEIELQAGILPQTIKEKVKISLGTSTLDTKEVSTIIKDNGQKILKIRPTELGYLNVRKQPTASSEDVARAAVGSMYVYTDVQDNFYKIRINDRDGWVSAKYIEIVK